MIDYASLSETIGQDWYGLDPNLGAEVDRHCPPEDRQWAHAKLGELGRLAGGVIARNAEVVDANPPQLVRYDRWANEVDQVIHHPAAIDSKRALWRAGYVGGFAGEEAKRGRPVPAIVRGAANYLVSQADTGLVCSTGMTAGVAGLVASYAPQDIRDQLLASLRADDMDHGADGSMFLTERDGGSDLGRTVHCRATDIGGDRVLIRGEKWFCSNIDGAAIVILARPETAPEGPAGLGLYLVPRTGPDGAPNAISIRRLKPKLGTRSVPTGEVEFHDALGFALRPRANRAGANPDAGGLGRMMEMVNDSRLGVAMMGLGIARRCFLESAVWAHHRQARGQLLVDLPLVREQLVDLLVDLEAAVALGFECVAPGSGRDAEMLRRILVPAAKVRLCRLGVHAASSTVELHGGNGYCEDWGIARQLRDAQCHPIWEGTEHICCLDVIRAARRDRADRAALARVAAALDRVRSAVGRTSGPPWLAEALEATAAASTALAGRFEQLHQLEPEPSERWAGLLTRWLASTVSAALLLEQAVSPGQDGLDVHKALVALRFTRSRLGPEDRAWGDRIAAVAGRALLAYEPVDEAVAAGAC
jgi:alkylation response protein AidB-like acyl-CoA dehydrogenase